MPAVGGCTIPLVRVRTSRRSRPQSLRHWVRSRCLSRRRSKTRPRPCAVAKQKYEISGRRTCLTLTKTRSSAKTIKRTAKRNSLVREAPHAQVVALVIFAESRFNSVRYDKYTDMDVFRGWRQFYYAHNVLILSHMNAQTRQTLPGYTSDFHIKPLRLVKDATKRVWHILFSSSTNLGPRQSLDMRFFKFSPLFSAK